jgi:multicomponent Na+:H+ antiporter subunit F
VPESATLQAPLLAVAAFLLVNVLVGLARVLRRPSPAEAMLAAQLFGTTGIAILLVLAKALDAPPLRNVALVFALLAVLATATFVRRAGTDREGERR